MFQVNSAGLNKCPSLQNITALPSSTSIQIIAWYIVEATIIIDTQLRMVQ